MIRNVCFDCKGDLVKDKTGYVCLNCGQKYDFDITPFFKNTLRKRISFLETTK